MNKILNKLNIQNTTKKRELTPDEEEILEKNLVWLFSSPRSDSSWLGLQYKTNHSTFLSKILQLIESTSPCHVI